MPDFAAMVERRDAQPAAQPHDLAERIRAHTRDTYPRILAAYGSSYANGWKFGRDRAADEIETEGTA